MSTNFRRAFSLLGLIAALLSCSCDNTGFREQIGEFQTAMSESRNAIGSYYLEMNQFERDLYLLQRELDGSKRVGVEYLSEKSTDDKFIFSDTNLYINGPFTRESIQARLDALSLIGLYGTRLAELAGTDAPTAFSDSSAALGSNIVNLSTTFRKLAKTEPANLSAASYIQPISKLVGLVGQLYLERKRDKALVSGIREASPQISLINFFLKRDLDQVVSPQRESGLKATIAFLTRNYDRKRADADRKTRRQMLDEINAAVRTYELFSDADPSKIIDRMEEANQALLTYANSGRNKRDLAQMVFRFGEFRTYAQKIAKNIEEIKEIRRSLRNAS